MKQTLRLILADRLSFLLIAMCLLVAAPALAQRQMENLGRGVVAVRSGNSAAYIGWRLLATDPEDIGFNLYRSQNGGAPIKLNAQPLTNTTDFVDSTVTLSVSNAWFVRPIIGGVEQAPSTPHGVPANALVPVDFQNKVGPYVSVPLKPISGGYYVHHCWPGDIDGDGEYDYVVTRLPNAGGVNFVEAYLQNGTFLWRMDMGPNSDTGGDFPPTGVSLGHSDNVTVYDMDGDGRAEVLVRTGNGVTVTNAVGAVVANITAGNNTTQFISVIDGLTGVEKARVILPNPVPSAGAMSSHFGIMYGDGTRPSLVVESINRNANGSFNLSVTIWDYRDGLLTNRWLWTPPNDGKNYARAHQIRIADVDGDGKDEFCEIGFVLRDNGTNAIPIWSNELLHGDRYHVADLDPDRPGLETYAAQQDNPNLLATALHDSATGEMIQRWFAGGVVDVGRANTGDVDLNVRGVELFSVQPGLWSCRGEFINNSPPYPNFSIWWDPDLAREQLDNARVDKYGVGRLISPYNMQNPAKSGRSTWRNAQPLYGDLFGDWREEMLFEATDESALIIFTPVTPNNTRMVSLAQDPQYRAGFTYKGYMQSIWPSFYLGSGMATPPIQPVSDADLVWRGNTSFTWDAATANWFTNNLWISNTTPAAFTSDASVLFDRSGSNHAPITIEGTVTPGTMKVHAATDYTFIGGTLAGDMELVKAGRGKLALDNTNTFTGRTLISEGLLLVNGALSSSPVVVRGGTWLDGRIGGNGDVGGGVIIEQGGGVSPGSGLGSGGVLNIANGVTLRGGTLNDFDLSDDPTGILKSNDLLNITGNLTLQGSNTLVIHKLNATLPPGNYPLITYSGALVGNLNSFVVRGLEGIPVSLANPPGAIVLVVKEFRDPTTVVWAGGPGSNWDLITSSNWWNDGVKDWFVPNDTVRFDNTGLTHPTVNLVGSLPTAGVTVDSTGNYTFTGSGRISGPGGLVKTNSGRLTVLTQNDYTGPTVVRGGIFDVTDLNVAGTPGPLGQAGAGPANLVFHGSTFRIASAQAYTDRSITLAAGPTTFDISPGNANVNLSGLITGPGALVKMGAGTLTLGGANNYNGGTLIHNSTLQPGSAAANTMGLGSGMVILTNGGILSLFGSAAGDLGTGNAGGPFANTLNVPDGTSGSFYSPFRFAVNSPLTGGGTLNVRVTGVRCNYGGNWSQFTGQINVSSRTGTSDFRISSTSGFANARLHLNNNVLMYSRAPAGVTIPIGQFSAAAGAILSAGQGSSEGSQFAVTWRVGGLNTVATFAGTIQGTTAIIKEGTGTWILTGTNTYSGLTTISNGAVQIGSGGNVGNLGSGNVVNHSSLIVNRSGTLADTNWGVISGNGDVFKRGSGTLTFTKTHTFGGAMSVEGGVLALTGSGAIANASNLIVIGGTLLDVSGRVGGGMNVTGGQTLSGNGSIRGNITLNNGAVLSPGHAAALLGTLTFSNALTLAAGSTSRFEISKAPTTNDVARVLGALANGGTLIVTNISGNSLAAGDTFKLFNAASYSGSFANAVLPPLDSGLGWDTNALNASGTISVVTVVPPPPPVFSAVGLFDGAFVFGGTGGVANADFYLLGTTNLANPLTNWTRLLTNQFDNNGNFNFTNTLNPDWPQIFYRLQLP